MVIGAMLFRLRERPPGPRLADLHPLRERGTDNYLWWLFEKLDDLRPLFRG